MDAINNADCCGVVDVMSSYFLSGLIIKSSHFKWKQSVFQGVREMSLKLKSGLHLNNYSTETSWVR